jgi:salicylate hydroxylase
MLPFMAQGAVMAIEDAHTLAQCLAQGSDPVAALQCYEGLRKGRTATVQRMSRDNIQFFHHADIPNLAERMSRHREAHLWLYGFDVTDQDFRSRAFSTNVESPGRPLRRPATH